MDRLRRHFPPGGLEALGLTEPKILESNQAKLIFQTYEHRRDGSVVLRPLRDRFRHGPGCRRRIVARDSRIARRRDFAIRSASGPQTCENRPGSSKEKLVGEVKIRSGWKRPGPEDDLLIVTRDILLTEDTISTPHAVDFRWGPHFGRGPRHDDSPAGRRRRRENNRAEGN